MFKKSSLKPTDGKAKWGLEPTRASAKGKQPPQAPGKKYTPVKVTKSTQSYPQKPCGKC